MADGSKVLCMEQVGSICFSLSSSSPSTPASFHLPILIIRPQAFWRTPHKPFRQRFWLVKPCPKELKCDVEVSSNAIRDMEEHKNFCDRPKDQRPLPEEVISDIAENLSTILLKLCERGKRCLYEATYCTSELTVLKNNEIHIWDRGYNDYGQQVWGRKDGPYKFRPAPASSLSHLFPLSFPPLQAMDKNMEGSYLFQERCRIMLSKVRRGAFYFCMVW